MDDLIAFIAARLDEREHFAKTARLAQKHREQMLREAGAMRAILDEHGPGYPVTFPKPSGQPACGVCHAGGWDWEPEQWPCPTVRHLAAVWSDHPDCRPEWKP